jgi:hypothetical protein
MSTHRWCGVLAVAAAFAAAGCSHGGAADERHDVDGSPSVIPAAASGARVGSIALDDGSPDPTACPDGSICGNMFGEEGPWPWMYPRDGGSRLPRMAGVHLRQGMVTVRGDLPTEVIQRIVRQNFGRFRLCYELGLRSNAALSGRVTVKFVIDRTGAVTVASDGGSDLPDASVVQCVVRAFGSLSFPSPSSGIVVVLFPIEFSSGS